MCSTPRATSGGASMLKLSAPLRGGMSAVVWVCTLSHAKGHTKRPGEDRDGQGCPCRAKGMITASMQLEEDSDEDEPSDEDAKSSEDGKEGTGRKGWGKPGMVSAPHALSHLHYMPNNNIVW